jgi:hypothetical protein
VGTGQPLAAEVRYGGADDVEVVSTLKAVDLQALVAGIAPSGTMLS